jgi:hypothetical protein
MNDRNFKKTNQLLASSNCAMLRRNLGNHFMGIEISKCKSKLECG